MVARRQTIKWLQQHQNHVFNVVCPHSGSLLSRHPFDQRKHQLSHNHSVIIDIGDNTIDTVITDEHSEESLSATVIDLRESINHLQKVNKELNTKYNNQREFVSLAAHELRSPILPILGTLECANGVLISYTSSLSFQHQLNTQAISVGKFQLPMDKRQSYWGLTFMLHLFYVGI